MKKSIATNALQRNFKQQHRQSTAPSSWAVQSVDCVILEVYDYESEPHMKQSKQTDNRIYAKVQVRNGQTYVLPFKESPDQIFSTYGNSINLQFKVGHIEFRNNNVGNGNVVISNHRSSSVVKLSSSTVVYSIGGLLNV